MLKHTKESLEPVIKKSLSWANVCRELGIKPATGSQGHIKKVAIKFKIDFSHFTGMGWKKNRTFDKKPIEDYLSGKRFITSHHLKLRLFDEGLKLKKCEECNFDKWMGIELPLDLDHINNNPEDNRLINLKILCPNCHAIKTRRERRKASMAKWKTQQS